MKRSLKPQSYIQNPTQPIVTVEAFMDQRISTHFNAFQRISTQLSADQRISTYIIVFQDNFHSKAT